MGNYQWVLRIGSRWLSDSPPGSVYLSLPGYAPTKSLISSKVDPFGAVEIYFMKTDISLPGRDLHDCPLFECHVHSGDMAVGVCGGGGI